MTSGRDLSSSAISKAVTQGALKHPSVIYPAGAALVAGAAALMLGPSLLAIGAAAVGGAIAAGAVLVNRFVRREKMASIYVREVRAQLLADKDRTIKHLNTALQGLGAKDKKEQLGRLQEKFDTFKGILDSKLKPSELTYGRYLGMSEQLYLSVLDNLERATTLLQSTKSIDKDFLQGRLSTLREEPELSAHGQQELDSLASRLDLLAQQQTSLGEILSQNEQAMTKLDLASAALADVHTQSGQASVDIEQAMEEMDRLARRAGNYSLKSPKKPSPSAIKETS